MKINKNEFIDYYIANSLFKDGNNLEGKFFELFKVYSSENVTSLEELRNCTDEFYRFLMNKASMLAKYSGESVEVVVQKIIDSKRSFESVFQEQLNNARAESFVNVVNDLAPSKNIHILDVGSGQVPYSSILLGQKFSEVSSMDNEFIMSSMSLRKMNVYAHEEYFKTTTTIEQYDMIVGRSPCTAIDSIVYLCAKYKKPYCLVLCDCSIPTKEFFCKKYNIDPKSISDVEPETSLADYLDYLKKYKGTELPWQSLLPAIDNNIKFYGNFAYNIDVSEQKVADIINTHNENRRRYNRLVPKINLFKENLSDYDLDLDLD